MSWSLEEILYSVHFCVGAVVPSWAWPHPCGSATFWLCGWLSPVGPAVSSAVLSAGLLWREQWATHLNCFLLIRKCSRRKGISITGAAGMLFFCLDWRANRDQAASNFCKEKQWYSALTLPWLTRHHSILIQIPAFNCNSMNIMAHLSCYLT